MAYSLRCLLIGAGKGTFMTLTPFLKRNFRRPAHPSRGGSRIFFLVVGGGGDLCLNREVPYDRGPCPLKGPRGFLHALLSHAISIVSEPYFYFIFYSDSKRKVHSRSKWGGGGAFAPRLNPPLPQEITVPVYIPPAQWFCFVVRSCGRMRVDPFYFSFRSVYLSGREGGSWL